MAILTILTVPDEALLKVSKEVTEFDERLHTLLDDMTETLLRTGDAGLAAPQVGRLIRVFIINTGREVHEFVNPEIVEKSKPKLGLEGCLSIPKKRPVSVNRFQRIKVRFQDRDGNYYEGELKGFPAICFQHEFDHLNGVLLPQE